MRLCIAALVACLILTCIGPASAHHSFTNFWYMDKTVDVTGIVKSLLLVNPHSELAIEVTEGAEKATWYITSQGTGSALRKGGWKPDTLVVGTKVTVSGHPSRKEGAKALAAGKITKEDGSVVWFGGGGNVPAG